MRAHYLHPDLAPAIRRLQESLKTAQTERDKIIREQGERDAQIKRLSEETRASSNRHRDLNSEIRGYEMALNELVTPEQRPWHGW